MKSCFSCLLLMAFSFVLIHRSAAQEMLGIVNSNYAGVNGLMMNASATGFSRYHTQANLLAGDLFISSNYFYVHKRDYSPAKVFSVDFDDPTYWYIYEYPSLNFRDTIQFYDYYKNTRQKTLYFNNRFAGPSLMYHHGRHAVSLITGMRNLVSIEKTPYDIANFIFRGQDFRPQHNITYEDGAFGFTALSYIEIGLGYAYSLINNRQGELIGGFTAKYLLGTGGGYAKIDNATYMVPNIDSIYFYDCNGEIGLDLPMRYSDNKFPVFDPLIKGTGMSVDVGFTYLWGKEERRENSLFLRKNDQDIEDYKLRLGLSVMDVGWVTLNKNVQIHDFYNVRDRLWAGLSTYETESVQHLLRSASHNLKGDSLASLTDRSSFRIYLPSALSIQADYNFGYNIYANLTYLQGFRLGKLSIRRPPLIAVTPRYETRNFEVNLPLSFHDFRQPGIGLAIRIFGLVIGTEKLGTFLDLTDVKGVDVYFSLGFSIPAKKREWRYKGTKTPPCDSYEDYKRFRIK